MTAETIIKENTRFDRSGSPVEVVVPYEVFIDFVETHGLDLSDGEKSDLRQARADIDAGRKDRFFTSEGIRKEFGPA